MAFSFPRWEALDRARDSLTEAQWDALRIAAVLGVLGLAAAGGYWIGRPAWRHWQNREALEQARHFSAQGDFRSMLLALRRATEMAPDDRATWQEVARELSAIGSPEELFAQEQLTRLAPADPAPRLALAQEALRFGRYDTAHFALETLDAKDRSAVLYHKLSAALALAEGRMQEMKRELAAVVALTPGDSNARFSFAALRIWNGTPAEYRAGMQEMEQLVSDPTIRVRAAIELIGATAREKAPAEMTALLRRLQVAFGQAPQPFASGSAVSLWNQLLAEMKTAAAPSPTDVALMARWLSDVGQRDSALQWLESLPQTIANAAAPAAMAAQLAAEGNDYAMLDQRLSAGAWGPWPRAAWQAASAAHRASGSEALVQWNRAVQACGDSLDGLRNLARLASIWQNPIAAENAWLAIIDRDPTVQWAFQALRGSYIARHDYSALLALYARRADRLPSDEAAAADWILLACLLDRSSSAVDTRAETLSASTPLNIVAKAATLWRLERPRQAEAKLDLLSADDRRGPLGSFWLAVVESDLGNTGAARIALADAERTPRLGPERSVLDTVAARLRM